ncbi:hypothetical protein [Georgenia wutianyii]|nr:hypothetical protein [Georgenia wutianyii]
MSGLPLSPFPPQPGLVPLGEQDAGVCVDGVCAVPDPAEDGSDVEER